MQEKVNWDERFMELSKYIASWSKDKSTKVGAVITDDNKRIVSVGYNGYPSGSNDHVEERTERPLKYKWTAHAEQNSILSAARNGVKTDGCIMYVMMFPCTECARAIIQSGIKKVVVPKPDFNNERWGEDFKISLEMLTECKVEIQYYYE